MSSVEKFLESCLVLPGSEVRLRDYDPTWAGDKDTPKAERREQAEKSLSESTTQLEESQDLLYAADTWSVLVVLQAMDAAGKDSTIKHVMSGVNPQGCEVHSFKQPSAEELDHDFLWLCSKVLPERGRIGIFNRSYYEEVLVTRVHPELIEKQRLPTEEHGKKLWEHRYESINNFERHLTRNSTKIIKIFLNVSREEQTRRLLERASRKEKHWKFSLADMDEREFWNDYIEAYEACLSETSTKWAPWHIVPADHKWVTRALVSHIIASQIKELPLEYPQLSDDRNREIEAAKKKLEEELKEKEKKD
jgi:PPK2 family polyphosphate:nucleotide phosphotransferase